jgi:hypothetical protein
VLAVGVPGLVLVAVGIPAASALFLWRKRQQLRRDLVLAASWSFMYGEYREG